jgi:fructan beta-fructosidase
LIDKASAEIFINNGEIAMTSLFFPNEIMNTLNFFATEGKLKAENITIYNIK